MGLALCFFHYVNEGFIICIISSIRICEIVLKFLMKVSWMASYCLFNSIILIVLNIIMLYFDSFYINKDNTKYCIMYTFRGFHAPGSTLVRSDKC